LTTLLRCFLLVVFAVRLLLSVRLLLLFFFLLGVMADSLSLVRNRLLHRRLYLCDEIDSDAVNHVATNVDRMDAPAATAVIMKRFNHLGDATECRSN